MEPHVATWGHMVHFLSRLDIWSPPVRSLHHLVRKAKFWLFPGECVAMKCKRMDASCFLGIVIAGVLCGLRSHWSKSFECASQEH